MPIGDLLVAVRDVENRRLGKVIALKKSPGENILVRGKGEIGLVDQRPNSAATSSLQDLAQCQRFLWQLHEAIVALGFYTVGQALLPYAQRLSRNAWGASLVFVLALAVVLVTYRGNHPGGHFAVMMAGKMHGDVLHFAGTALAGTAAVLALGMMLAGQQWLGAIGRNSLPLLGLDGAFYHFFNPQIAAMRPPADAPGAVIVYSVAVSVMSLLACVPIVILLNRFVPQLVGQSQRSGPWLPSFEGYLKRREQQSTATGAPTPPPAA